MHRRNLSVLLAVALVGGLLVVAAATPAMSQDPPPASLLPDQDGTAAPAKLGNVLSDKHDGTDDLAHLTVAAPLATERVVWRRCPTTAPSPLTNAALATCNILIGEDTTGKAVGPTGGFLAPDEAYDITWDINFSGVVDIAVLACVGPGENVEAGGNCLSTLEETITIEDTDDADLTDTSAGEITSICTRGPATCTLAGNPAVTAADFRAWTHGDPVPNDGFTIRATTSPELNVAPLLHAELFAASSASEQDGAVLPGADNACVLISALATHATWECTFSDLEVPDNTTMSVLIDNNGGGVGNCAGAGVFCILDSHFTQSQTRAASKVAAYFVRGNATWSNNDVTAGSSCGTPDTEDTNQLSDVTLVLGCVQDQFQDPFATANVTFASAGVGEVTDTDAFSPAPAGAALLDPCDRLHDHDAAGGTEHCHKDDATPAGQDGVPAAADAWARYSVLLDNDDTVGDQTLTFCVDDENGGTDATQPANHGCADEPANLVTTVKKTWRSLPDHIHLVFDGTATDPADPCHTGDRSAQNKVGDTEVLLVCTYDDTETTEIAATTDQPDGGRINWFITPSGGGEKTATRFKGATPPPAETGPDGRATATIKAFRRGNDNIRVDLEDSEGVTVVEEATDQVQKRVTGGKGGGKRAESSVSIRGSFKGQVSSARTKCKVNRKVFLKRKRPGKDQTVGTDRTNGAGNWRERVNNPSGRYYAKINRTKRCKGDRSPTIRK